MSNLHDWEEGCEWMIMPGGIVVEPEDNHGEIEFEPPNDWTRIPVKFGNFPSAYYKLYDCKLGTLENSPTAVNSMVVKGGRMASLKGGPSTVENDLTLVNCSLTSLVGAPNSVNRLILRKLNRLTTLHGLEEASVGQLDIQDCSGLKSFDGMPKHIEYAVLINNLESCEAIRFPQYVTMDSGTLYIGANIANKLSPTLVTVPGLTAIDWLSTAPGYHNDILKLFNKYLRLPKTTRTYLSLQTELIDQDMDWLAEL